VDGDKIAVVTNGVDNAHFAPRPKDAALVRELGLEGKFVAGYVGTLGLAHALETLLAAADLLRKRPDGDAFRILLLGHGARRSALIEQTQRMGLDNVIFLDSVSKEEVARYWSLLDVSIIHLSKAELFSMVIPSKLFECMGMGIPVLHGVAGESADIVVKECIGEVFEPENAEQLVEGLERMRNEPSAYGTYRANCVNAAGKYDRAALALKMLRAVL
jgi:glycosyltransferase involved in cell wall biosynthesis